MEAQVDQKSKYIKQLYIFSMGEFKFEDKTLKERKQMANIALNECGGL